MSATKKKRKPDSSAEMALTKEYSNQLCEKYGISKTEVQADRNRIPQWKQDLRDAIQYALDTAIPKRLSSISCGCTATECSGMTNYTTLEGYK